MTEKCCQTILGESCAFVKKLSVQSFNEIVWECVAAAMGYSSTAVSMGLSSFKFFSWPAKILLVALVSHY